MKIAQDLAGYSLGDADLLRRAMGKKNCTCLQKKKNITNIFDLFPAFPSPFSSRPLPIHIHPRCYRLYDDLKSCEYCLSAGNQWGATTNRCELSGSVFHCPQFTDEERGFYCTWREEGRNSMGMIVLNDDEGSLHSSLHHIAYLLSLTLP